MPTLRLRHLAVPALLLLAAACESPSQPNEGPETPSEPAPQVPAAVTWLKANAHPIRTLSVTDGDFSDLRPLRTAIGDARVVMLGEQSHGDGTTFLAKARLVAFLHQEMGFDVLAWESGLWDVAQAWKQVQAGAKVADASRRSLFGVWAGSAQVRPTLDYVAGTLATARPLEMAGVDLQFSGSVADDSLHLLTERFALRIGSSVKDDPEWPAAMETLRQLVAGLHYDDAPGTVAQLHLLRLLATLRADAAARPATDREALFWTQVLESTDVYARAVWGRHPSQPGIGSARDVQMARNLVWLANVYYPGRKIIVWAASIHVARDVTQLRNQNGEQPYLNVSNVLMGGEAYRELGTSLYTIGFTAGTGTWGRWDGTAKPVSAPVAGSLEAYLAQAGFQNAFVDFRARAPGGGWLAYTWTRPFGYVYMRGDWTRVFDGMIFTAHMEPSTPASP